MEIIHQATVSTQVQGLAGMTFGLWEREREWQIPFPKFQERESEWEIPFPTFGNGKFHSQFSRVYRTQLTTPIEQSSPPFMVWPNKGATF